MLFIQEMKPELNTQSDSIKAKLLSTSLSLSTFPTVVFSITCNEIFTHISVYKELTRIWLLIFTNLKMMNDSSKRHSQFLSLIFILNHTFCTNLGSIDMFLSNQNAEIVAFILLHLTQRAAVTCPKLPILHYSALLLEYFTGALYCDGGRGE